MKSYKDKQDVDPEFARDFRDDIIQQPVTKIVFAAVAIVGGIYLLGLTAKVVSGAITSFKNLRDSLRK